MPVQRLALYYRYPVSVVWEHLRAGLALNGPQAEGMISSDPALQKIKNSCTTDFKKYVLHFVISVHALQPAAGINCTCTSCILININ